MRLPYRPPFRWDAIVRFLQARAVEAVESFEGGVYRRGVTIAPARGNALAMTVPPELAHDIEGLAARARRTFDLGADPETIDGHLRRDPLLRPLIARRPGPRVPGAWDPFEIAVRAIVGQQITVRAATTIMNRLAPLLTPARLADANLDAIGMPRARREAIRTLARAVADEPSLLSRGATLDESVARLMALRGIGEWTAHYVAMRSLSEPDAFPHTDLGLRKAAAAIGIDPAKLLQRAERWRPWRAYAAIVLWESL